MTFAIAFTAYTLLIVAVLWPRIYVEAATGVHIYNLPLAFDCALIVSVFVSLLVPSSPTDGGGAIGGASHPNARRPLDAFPKRGEAARQ